MTKLSENIFIGSISDTDEHGLFHDKTLVIFLSDDDRESIKSNLINIETSKNKGQKIDGLDISLGGDFFILDESKDVIAKAYIDDPFSADDVCERFDDLAASEGVQYPELTTTSFGETRFSAAFKHVRGECESHTGICSKDILGETKIQTIVSSLQEDNKKEILEALSDKPELQDLSVEQIAAIGEVLDIFLKNETTLNSKPSA